MNPKKETNNQNLHVWTLLSLTILFVVTRLTNLTLLPVFNDEAVYLNWARMISNGETQALLSVVVDNKKPLQVWLIALGMEIFNDPLVAGRFASVFAGGFTITGIYFSAARLFSPSAGFLAALAYIVCPYTLIFDRQAQESSLLSACMAWSIWLSISLTQDKYFSKKHAVAVILTTGLGLLVLSTALLFIFIPFLIKFFYLRKECFKWYKKFAFSYGVGLFIAASPYAMLYMTTEHFQLRNIIIPKTHHLSQSGLTDFLINIPAQLSNGLSGVVDYFWTYLTPPLCLLAFGGLVIGLGKNVRPRGILSVYFFVPVLMLLGTAGSGFSRYYVFCAIPLLISLGGFLAFFLATLKKSVKPYTIPIVLIFIIGTFFYSGKFALDLIIKPMKATYVERDAYQFIFSQFSGYGIPQAVNFLRERSHKKKIAVLTTTNWGVPADAIYAYLSNDINIDLYSAYWVFSKPLMPKNLQAVDIHQRFTGKFLKRLNPKNLPETYFIRRTSPNFDRTLFMRINPNFKPVKFFSKPGGQYFVEIYKLKK